MSTIPILDDPTYRIESELGSGGGGVVYKAWHKRLKKYVVLKRIKESALTKPDYQRIEVDILKNLKHSHLPQLYDFISDDGGTYTVMELIPGHSFAELLENGQRFSQQQVIRWAEQLSSALTYLHGQKPPVLHSDIKPANVMLTPDGDVCLIDFNVSLVLSGDSADVIGRSHGYASPEQYGPEGLPSSQQVVPESSRIPSARSDNAVVIENLPDDEESTEKLGSEETEFLKSTITELSERPDTSLVIEQDDMPEQEQQARNGTNLIRPWDLDTDKFSSPVIPSDSDKRKMKIRMDTRSDIYSLGATMYHLLTGEKPGIATGRIKPLNSFDLTLSEGIVFVIEKCMERDPAMRFQSAAQLHKAVTDIHKLDNRWKRQNIHKNIAAVVLTTMFVLSGVSIMLGWNRLGEEKLAKYNQLVHAISEHGGEAYYLEAVALFPEKIDAYYAWALAQSTAGSYGENIGYINSVMSRLSAHSWDAYSIRRIGDIWFIQGSCYFELEDYDNAAACYESAIKNNPDNPEFYRDYAIASARRGDIDKAAELFDELEVMKIGNDSVSLLRGEIAYARQNYDEAVEYFKKAINESVYDNIKQRAYLICDRAYQKISGKVEDEIALLREAMRELPVSYQPVVMERLAEALVRAGQGGSDKDSYYREAITLFEELKRRGNATYGVRQNIGLLYQELGDYDAARTSYIEMLSAFPDRYQVPMRLTFLTLEEQAALPNDEREYAETAEWYGKALDLYSRRPQNAGDDMEMLMLESVIGELRQNGWLDGEV